ncbi:MAG: hypothetical protein JSS93_14245 [Bacteroidetes bacterium]|nr:hypothetical protein [Bacteroidota bacterium]MBS1558471.1 hypothetical protein [Bacteroidota bacterium]
MKKKKETAKSEAKNNELKKQNFGLEENQEKENPFDFGGLPQMNLKKNLGCG